MQLMTLAFYVGGCPMLVVGIKGVVVALYKATIGGSLPPPPISIYSKPLYIKRVSI